MYIYEDVCVCCELDVYDICIYIYIYIYMYVCVCASVMYIYTYVFVYKHIRVCGRKNVFVI